MRACHKHKVRRLVITSSIIAITGAKIPEGKVFTEDDWSDSDTENAYDKSKTMAEKAAWDFVRNLPEEERFELVVINPSFILGPNLIYGDFSSGQVIAKIMAGKFPGMPAIMMPAVDVRDVALMHLLALKKTEVANHRVIASNKSMWFKEIANILNEEYGQHYKIKTGELKYCTAKLASFFDPAVKTIIPIWKKELFVSNEKSKQMLGVEYTDMRKSLVDMVESLIKYQQIPD
mmetsp:Transcript_23156/g.22635  ORF Transcript_23156/g.22635 Transcript_23156/m.22635 type:complete len:233 (-) Transcript_23156:59-757(-)|eukprot:CAMPEP_0170543422 /NCGR_PEP_ID=MMETSP0211-20121228/2538_1 /TAXON_ID=311385 /ORGANISM="Pseudokeronopsis sp., Strain OXSARD2" /LENGTH=232 /DNA_ID=CAMNT_0010846787 /DNA_START=352 /DNA_END=1050 /DNA_ORIENTATION=+